MQETWCVVSVGLKSYQVARHYQAQCPTIKTQADNVGLNSY